MQLKAKVIHTSEPQRDLVGTLCMTGLIQSEELIAATSNDITNSHQLIVTL